MERTRTSRAVHGGGHRRPALLVAAALAVPAAALLGAGCGAVGSSGGASSTTDTLAGAVGQPAPAGTGALAAVACGSAAACWAVGSAATNVLNGLPTATTRPPSVVLDHTTDGGLTWSAVPVPVADPTDLDAVSCPDTKHCMAVGSADVNGPLDAAVLVTTDAGRAWRAATGPAAAVDLSAVQCTTPSDCLVLATNGTTYWSAVTTDGGTTWLRQGDLPAGFGGSTSVTCPSATDCLAPGYVSTTPGKGGGAVAVTADGGTTWTAASVPAGTGLLHAVACPEAVHCIAVGTASSTDSDVSQGQGAMLASADGGATWAATPAPAGIDDAFAISCPSALNCATVGTVWTPTNPPTPIGGVEATTDGGATWSPPPVRYVPSGLTGVACPTARSCVAAGNDVLARIVIPKPPPRHQRA